MILIHQCQDARVTTKHEHLYTRPMRTKKDIIVSDYVQSYFGDALNEGVVDDDDIMESFAELLETADAVREFMVDEGILSKAADLAKKAAKAATSPKARELYKKVAKKTATVAGIDKA